MKRFILDKFNMKEVDEKELTASNVYYKLIGDFKYWLYNKGYAPKYWDRQIKYILQLADKKCSTTGTCKCGCDLIKMILSGKQCEDKCYMWLNKKEFRLLEINLMTLKLYDKQTDLNQLPIISEFTPLVQYNEKNIKTELSASTDVANGKNSAYIKAWKSNSDNNLIEVKNNNKIIDKPVVVKSAPTMKETVFNLKYITDETRSKTVKTFTLNIPTYTVTKDEELIPFSFLLKMKNIEVDEKITSGCSCTNVILEKVDADSVRIKGSIKASSIKTIENYPDKTINKAVGVYINYKDSTINKDLQKVTVNLKVDIKI